MNLETAASIPVRFASERWWSWAGQKELSAEQRKTAVATRLRFRASCSGTLRFEDMREPWQAQSLYPLRGQKETFRAGCPSLRPLHIPQRPLRLSFFDCGARKRNAEMRRGIWIKAGSLLLRDCRLIANGLPTAAAAHPDARVAIGPAEVFAELVALHVGAGGHDGGIAVEADDHVADINGFVA